MSIMTETIYTAYALTSRGREEIECYGTVQEAVQDMLELWPEEDEGDVVIDNNQGVTVVYFVRSDADPLIVHLYFLEDAWRGFKYIESYRCHYEPAQGGSVRTVIKRLA